MNKTLNVVPQESQKIQETNRLRLKLPLYGAYGGSKLDAVNRLEDVSRDIQDLKSMVPGRGYDYRARLIESNPDMKVADRLAESYMNDEHALDMLREAADIQNSVRSSRSKNCFLICLGGTLLGLSYPVGKALGHLISSKWGGQDGSRPN